MVTVYIPTPQGERILDEVYHSISCQDVVKSVEQVSRGRRLRHDDPEYFKNIAKTRRKIIGIARKRGDEYLVMNDSTKKHLKADNIQRMLDFLNSNMDWGAVALYPRKIVTGARLERRHIHLDCMMFRVAVLPKIKFKVPDGSCECFCVTRELRPKWRVGYLETKKDILLW